MTIIAIDGPSGSGKSTVAREIAERLRLPYLDTGAMYRAIGMVALKRDVKMGDGVALGKLAAEVKMQLLDERSEGKLRPRIIVMGVDCTTDIRTPEVSQAASGVAVHPEVRERLVSRQRNWIVERGGGVVEGRDIGTVVFPDADLKIFLTANDEERAKRRQTDMAAPGFDSLSDEDTKRHLAERDKRDSSRQASPLAVADGAFVVDTSDKDVDTVVMEILAELRRRSGGSLPTGKTS